jgi:hypothetical protein
LKKPTKRHDQDTWSSGKESNLGPAKKKVNVVESRDSHKITLTNGFACVQKSLICLEQGLVVVVMYWENDCLTVMMANFLCLLHHTHHHHHPACGDDALALCVKNHKHAFHELGTCHGLCATSEKCATGYYNTTLWFL